MKLTAQELYRLQVIDRILPEFGGANSETADKISEVMQVCMAAFFKKAVGADKNLHRVSDAGKVKA